MTMLDGPALPYIAGAPTAVGDAELLPIVDPATEVQFGGIAMSRPEDVDAAVDAATEAQRQWVRLSPDDRSQRIWRFGELVARDAAAIAELDSREMGKPISDAVAEAKGACRAARYWAGMTDKVSGRHHPFPTGHLTYTVREPVGVVAAIIPWNAPTSSFMNRVTSALGTGNAVVTKPSERSTLSSLRIARLLGEANIPNGMVSVLTGDGRVGDLLARHPGVGAVSFTGSVATGRAVNRAAADTFKQVTLELGGKAPNIVFADADLRAAALGATYGIFFNAGQICVAGTRLLVEESVAEKFLDELVELAALIRVGAPSDPSVQVGPLVCRTQYDRVQEYLSVGRQEGTLVLGGGRPADVGARGFYVAPTIFRNLADSGRILREEIFGPVLAVQTFSDDNEALALANDTEYGLSANVWTRDLGRALRFAEELEAGTIWCNSVRVMDPALPFGGFKNSGLGNATGDGAIEGMTRLRRVTIRHDDANLVVPWNLPASGR